MIIKLEHESYSQSVLAELKALSIDGQLVKTQSSLYIVVSKHKEIDLRRVGKIEGVKDVHRVTDPYKLVSKKWRLENTVIELNDGVKIGDKNPSLMLGPCSIETPEQIDQILQFLVKNKIQIVRGGAFKPRSSPYSFRGLGIPGLKMLYEKAKSLKIKVISEVLEIDQIEEMYPYVDIFQVGTRNSQNFNLLNELGKVDKPVLIKRAMSGTLEELLQSAEYVFSNGNEKILLCERGIRTFEKAYRNVFDINAIPYLKEKSHLPVIADPSHGVGIRRFVCEIALAAIVAGADGILVEIHPEPEKASSDGDQSLNFQEAEEMIERVRKPT